MYILNGHLKSGEKIKLSIDDQCLNFGSGIFETIKVIDNMPLFFQEHYDRLLKSASFFGHEFPYSIDELMEMLTILLSKEKIDAIKVLYAFGKDENYIIIKGRTFDFDRKLLSCGVALDICEYGRHSKDFMLRHKTMNYMGNNYFQNSKKDAYETIFLNEMGNITEGSKTNIFFIGDQNIITPNVDQGLLPGIMRGAIIDSLRGRGLDVIEDKIELSDLSKYKGAFITNSLIGAVPVKKIGNHEYSLDSFSILGEYLKKDGILCKY